MRKKLMKEGAGKLSYEIREIVAKAHQLQGMGREISWENIGDPIQKSAKIPSWMKGVLEELIADDKSYGYSHSMGNLETRKYLAAKTNARGGVEIGADDILFFNGLGDAISTIYSLLEPSARVIGPSPGYTTHASSEGAHAGSEPLTYRLDPYDGWRPDLEDLEAKVRANPDIVGLLIINPDNPTGVVHSRESLEKMLEIARAFDLFVIVDEIYAKITYGDAEFQPLCRLIGDLPGMAMRGISKDYPWPGSRCGWVEFYNRDKNPEFARYCAALCNAKMIEVCATTLPQLSIPKVYEHPEFPAYRERLNCEIGERGRYIFDTLGAIPELVVNEVEGAFYHTVVFREGVLRDDQSLAIDDPDIRSSVESWVEGVKLDYRFVYYLLGATGICVVPASSFYSPLDGFRITALEENPAKMRATISRLGEAIREYVGSGGGA